MLRRPFSTSAVLALLLIGTVPLQQESTEGTNHHPLPLAENSDPTGRPMDPADFIRVSWNPKHRVRYRLDVKPVGADYIAPCVDHRLLRGSLSYLYDGRCPSSDKKFTGPVESFRICMASPAPTPEEASCVEAPYHGGSTLHIDSGQDHAGDVVLRWPAIPEAEYRLNLRLSDGTTVRHCARTDKPEYLFDGRRPARSGAPVIALADVKLFEVQSSVHGQWTIASTRDVARARYNGKGAAVSMRFRRFRDMFFEEQCFTNGSMNPQYLTSHTMTAQMCRDSTASDDFEPHAPNAGYGKRRLTKTREFIEMGYPRSAADSDGAVYLLFSTPSGGFPPGGTPPGCRELNLVRTFDFRQYDFVAQVERLCSHQRLDNGELAIFGDRMYVTFHTIGEAGQCITPEGRPGADWQLRLKVSRNYRSTPANFTDLGGHEGAEILQDRCIANGSFDGFWEPMIFRSADRTIRIAYTDDTPSEVPDGNCNQFIRVLGYSEDQRKVISNDAIGNCTGDKREGMPVVAESASGSYGMVYESLGTPSDQIKMVTSRDGITWSAPAVLADVSIDGGTSVGCPYLRYVADDAYVAFYHAFRNPVTHLAASDYQIRILDRKLQRRMDILVEKRTRASHSSGLHLYWGSINVVGDQIYALGAGGDRSPFVEVWLPQLGE